FGTTPCAAPGLGVLTGLIMLVCGQAWLNYRAGKARAAGEGYGEHHKDRASIDKSLREHAACEGFDLLEIPVEEPPRRQPSLPLAILPIVLVIGLNLVFTTLVIPVMDTDYLAEPQYGATTIEALRGVWSVIGALVIAIGVLVISNLKRLPKITATLDSGANASLVPIFNTASLVGFGSVIASLAAFEMISEWITTVGGDNPLISLAIAVNVLAGMTGSASGGMSIALATLGDTYMAMGQAAGISPELLHRVTSVATGGLDALPHNGAVITLLSICGLKHSQAYLDIAVVAVLVPILSLVFLIIAGTMIGTF
ncbi:MAG: GntP family permease, partial [Desulfovermiculus sp.]|nr:GntP family permease [Desulfovermiculus sp.]